MTDLTYTGYPQTIDDYASEDSLPPPAPRRKLPVVTAILVVGVVATAGFYAGVRVQKSHGTTSSSGTTAAAARTAAAATGRAGAAATGAAGAAAAGRGRTVGLVTAIEGNSLLITDSTGNTVKVSTNDASTITKTSAATLADLHPGDVVVITGTKAADGTTAASSISVGGATGAGGFGGGGAAGGGFGGGGAAAGGAAAGGTGG